MSVLLTILALLTLADLLIALAVVRAPDGYEDKHGFHSLGRRRWSGTSVRR